MTVRMARPHLTTLFTLLFGLTVLVPILGLIYTTLTSLDTARALTRHMVNEHQTRYGSELDAFLIDRYLPGLMQISADQTTAMNRLLPGSVPAMPELTPAERIRLQYCTMKKLVEENWLHPLGFEAENKDCNDMAPINDSPVRMHLLEYFYGAPMIDYADVIAEVMDPKTENQHKDPRVRELAHRMQAFQDTYRGRRRLYEQLGIIQYPTSLFIRDAGVSYPAAAAPDSWREDLQLLFLKLQIPSDQSIITLSDFLRVTPEETRTHLGHLVHSGPTRSLSEVRDTVRFLEKLRLNLLHFTWGLRDEAVAPDRERSPLPQNFRPILQAVHELTGAQNTVLATALEELDSISDLSRRSWEALPRAMNLYRTCEDDWLSDYHEYGEKGDSANFRSTKIRPLHRIGHYGAVEDYYRIADLYFSPDYDAYDLNRQLDKAGSQISSHDPVLNAMNLILKFLVSGAVSRELFMNSDRSMLVRTVMGVDVGEMIEGKFVLVRSGQLQVLVSSRHFPTNFNSLPYHRGIGDPPPAMALILGDRIKIGRLFASFVNLPTSGNETYADLIQMGRQGKTLANVMHSDDKVISQIRQLHEELIQHKHGNNQPPPSILEGLGLQLSEFLTASPEIRTRIRTGQKAHFQLHSTVRLLPQTVAEAWMETSGVSNGIRKGHSGDNMIVTVVPATTPMLENWVYITEIPESIAFHNQKLFLLIALCLATLGVTGAMFFGVSMSRKMVKPLLTLDHKVRQYSKGVPPGPMPHVKAGDAIEEMDQNFHTMAETIETKLAETDFLNSLNIRTTRGEPAQAILGDLFQRLMEVTNAHSIQVKFMERENPNVVINAVNIVKEESASPVTIPLQDPFETKTQSVSSLIGTMSLHGGTWPPAEKSAPLVLSLCSLALAISGKAWLDKLKKDNVEGQEIQLSLMPQTAPDIKGIEVASSYVAARFLGGDFYDWLQQDTVLDVIISDVSGKGVGAALFGASCKSILRHLLTAGLSPGAVLVQLNHLLCEGKDNSLFASLFLARFDRHNLRLHFASAGHNRMILLHSDGSMTLMSAKGLPLGMFTPGKYEDKTLELKTGDLVCLYTDGITELEDPMLNLYGNERLERLLQENRHLPVDDIKQVLLKDLNAYRGSRPASDDITLVLIKIT